MTPNNSTEQLQTYLEQFTWEGQWEKVIVMYYKFPEELHTNYFVKLKGTALHVAIDLNKEYVVKELLNAILTHHYTNIDPKGLQRVEALEIENDRGDTPLHYAASRGFAIMCKWIIGFHEERIYLLSNKNKIGETPLFQAVVNNKKQTFAYLSHSFRERYTSINYHNSRDIETILPDFVREDGDSILHAAIRGEYFGLAVIIVRDYDFLIKHYNFEGSTPLKVLATRPSAFKSASNFSWYKRILYHCIAKEQLNATDRKMNFYLREIIDNQNSNKMKLPNNDVYNFIYTWLDRSEENIEEQMEQFNPENLEMKQFDVQNPSNDNRDRVLPLNYETVQPFFKCAYDHILGFSKKKKQSDAENPSSAFDHSLGFSKKKKQSNAENPSNESKKHQVGFWPSNYETFQQFVKFGYVHILGLSGVGVKDVKTAKKHERSSQLLKVLMKTLYKSFTGSGGRPTESEIDPDIYNISFRPKQDGITKRMQSFKKQGTTSENEIDIEDTPFLIAARNGILEIVNEILNKIPSAIHNINSKKENALHVAVKYRHPVVVHTLRKHSEPEVWKNMVLAVDRYENTILHLAADVLEDDRPLQVSGSALQMMWDIKWFQYIQSLVPQHFYFISNNVAFQTPCERSNDSQTPRNQTADEIFRSKHENLISRSSGWLQDTSESCSLVAALIAGVSFATASSVPGGTTDEGTPTLEGKPAFNIFTISSLFGNKPKIFEEICR